MGGGDVKLLAVLAVLAGPGLIALLLLVTTISGAVQALWALWTRDDRARTEGLPYGVAIALGGLAVAVTMMLS
jgi:Flp pilus assembly protein protease CpaA